MNLKTSGTLISLVQRSLMVILFIWELPQNIVGGAIFLFRWHAIKKIDKMHQRLFIATNGFSVSLGFFIFYIDYGQDREIMTHNCRIHEYGHSIQSIFFGPVYLIFAGIPSLLRLLYNIIYSDTNGNKWTNYFKGYPENWANSLGSKYYEKGD